MRPTVGVTFLLGLIGSAALACSCPRPRELPELIAGSKHVFVAQIRSATLSGDGTWVEGSFVAEELFKGDSTKVGVIKARFEKEHYDLPGELSCGQLLVAPGMRFLVFASDDGPTVYGQCTDTRVVRKRDDALVMYLRSVLHPK